MSSKQNGFTLIELMIVVLAITVVAILGSLGYAAVHFISKFW